MGTTSEGVRIPFQSFQALQGPRRSRIQDWGSPFSDIEKATKPRRGKEARLLKGSNWNWPRLVDIEGLAPAPRRRGKLGETQLSSGVWDWAPSEDIKAGIGLSDEPSVSLPFINKEDKEPVRLSDEDWEDYESGDKGGRKLDIALKGVDIKETEMKDSPSRPSSPIAVKAAVPAVPAPVKEEPLGVAEKRMATELRESIASAKAAKAAKATAKEEAKEEEEAKAAAAKEEEKKAAAATAPRPVEGKKRKPRKKKATAKAAAKGKIVPAPVPKRGSSLALAEPALVDPEGSGDEGDEGGSGDED